MGLVDSKVVLFNDGEDLEFGDLNDLAKGATQRAWEWPGYADALAHGPIVGSGGTSADYDTLFSAATDVSKIVFTKGVGLFGERASLNLTLGNGFLGIYVGGGPPSVLVPQMQWVYIGSPVTFARPAAPAGQKRYDVFTLSIAESNGEPASRDFQDSTTGALSTTTPNKRTLLTGTITVTAGTAGATPTPPSVSGYVIGMALVDSSTIVDWFDCTQPFGQGYTCLSVPAIHGFSDSAEWVPYADGQRIASANGVYTAIVPPMFGGDPGAKLIGIEISYILSAAATVDLVRYTPGGGTVAAGSTQIVDLTSFITTGVGTATITTIDMRGYPYFLSGSRGPAWGNGFHSKQGAGFSPGCTLALRVKSGTGSPNTVNYVRWHFAKG